LASRRAAVLVAAAAAVLATAHAAPAATLGVQVSLPDTVASSLPKGTVPNVEVAVKTPIVEASVEASDRGAATMATVPPATGKPSTPVPSEPRADARPERRPSDARQPQRHGRSERKAAPAVVERVAPPQVEPPAPVTGGPTPPSAPRPPAPEPASLTADGPLALADAVSPAGTPAALAALFVLAVVFASWIAPLIARTLAPPLLSFALQRPG
jgi:hypothetical protein